MKMNNDDIICDECGFAMVYDFENTMYLKCPCCDKVLIDRRAEDVWNEPLSVVDCGKIGDSLWVKVGDSKGAVHTCWRD